MTLGSMPLKSLHSCCYHFFGKTAFFSRAFEKNINANIWGVGSGSGSGDLFDLSQNLLSQDLTDCALSH